MKKETIFVSVYIFLVLTIAVIVSLSGCKESDSEGSIDPFFSEEFIEEQRAYNDSFQDYEICKGQGLFIPVNFEQEFKVTNPTMDENRIIDIKVLRSWGGILVTGFNEGEKRFSFNQDGNYKRLNISVKAECETMNGVIVINPATSFQEVLHEQSYSQFLDILAQVEDSGFDESVVFLSEDEFINIETKEP
jgi:hypothetical protein